MRQWQPIISERLLDLVQKPSDELGVADLHFSIHASMSAFDLFELAVIVKPAQYLQAIAATPSGEMIDWRSSKSRSSAAWTRHSVIAFFSPSSSLRTM